MYPVIGYQFNNHMYIYHYIPGKPQRQHFLPLRVWNGLDMFGHFFCSLRFFPNTAMSGCKPCTYRSIVFLKSLICQRTGSDSVSVSSRDCVWGSDICLLFFFNMMLKKVVFYGYIQIWWEQWQYLRPDLGYPITTPNLLHFGLKFLFWRLSEDVGCPHLVLSKDLNNHSQPKSKISNWT